jgi:ferrous iron transport protein B
MGFIKGQKIRVVRNAPLKDPIEYSLMDYSVSLRRAEARLIEVVTEEEARRLLGKRLNGSLSEDDIKRTALQKSKQINVALVGNPNCGKTTLFNSISRSKEHVGNYGGVTIESKTATFEFNDYTFNLVDLPGTYSLSAFTPEELYVRKYLLGELPDIVINVVDASNLERNLYLTTQLIDMDLRIVMALNMYDEIQKTGDQLDYQALGSLLGMPVVPTISTRGKGVYKLFEKIIDVYEDRDPASRHVHINFGKEIEDSIHNIQDLIWKNSKLTIQVSSRFYAIKLLEKDKAAHFSLSRWENYEEIRQAADKETGRLETLYHEDTGTLITDARYGFISGALKETLRKGPRNRREMTEQIDRILTHRIWGYPLFFLFLFFTFFATFEVGKYPVDWLNRLVLLSSGVLGHLLPEGSFRDLIVNGIIGGIGSVIVFLPNILILFFFISFMEDSGYMARAAFIMDKLMHKIGLHGRSFIPLLMGFGCNVPAIMATRTIPNRNNRLLTMLINPLMSCSARLPIYILIISAFFPSHAALILMGIYLTGILLAAVVARIFKKLLFRKEEAPFVMELPPYRMPTLKTTLKHMWNKGEEYLKKMGTVILVAVVLIWALTYFPRPAADNPFEKSITVLTQQLQSAGDNSLRGEKIQQQLNELNRQKDAYTLKNSYIGRIGKAITPLFRPLGFDWKMSVSLLAGITAKEIVVSTMGVLYQGEDEHGTSSELLAQRLQDETFTEGPRTGEQVFTTATVFAFLIFILVYFPCVATVTAIARESGSWRWALLAIVYTTVLAWILAFIIRHIFMLFT